MADCPYSASYLILDREACKVNLRQATPDDADSLFALHRAVFKTHIEVIWGWDETWQRSNFQREAESCSVLVIEIAGQAVGYMQVGDEPDRIYLRNIALSAAIQGKGIGSDLVRELQCSASERKVPLVLSVFRMNNRAQRFYERLGFRQIRESETHIEMSWCAV